MITSTLTGEASPSRENTGMAERPSLPLGTTSLGEEKLRGAVTGEHKELRRSAVPRGQRQPPHTRHAAPVAKLKTALNLLDQIDANDCQDYTLAVSSLSAAICDLWSGAHELDDLHRQALAAVDNAVCCLVHGDEFSEEKREAIRMGIIDMKAPVLTRESVESLNSFLMDAGFTPASFITSEAD